MNRRPLLLTLTAFLLLLPREERSTLRLNDLEYFETRGLNILVFSNWYNDLFSDSKISGIEIIHHEVRTATNGDVRLSPTPEQWDPIPQFLERRVDRSAQSIEAFLRYPSHDFAYSIRAKAREGGVVISVNLEQPLSETLEGLAGFNLEFLPSLQAVSSRVFWFCGPIFRKTKRTGLFCGGRTNMSSASVPIMCSSSMPQTRC